MDDFARPASALIIPRVGGEDRAIPNTSEPAAGQGLTLDGFGRIPKTVRDIKTGDAADRPAASVWADAFYYATDTGVLSYSNGSAWTDISGAVVQTYAAAWASTGTQPAIGNGTIVGKYVQIGKLVLAEVKITAGSTTTFGTGSYSVSLPVTVLAGSPQLGQGLYLDSSAGALHAGPWQSFLYSGTSPVANVSATVPFTWATGDIIYATMCYLAA